MNSESPASFETDVKEFSAHCAYINSVYTLATTIWRDTPSDQVVRSVIDWLSKYLDQTAQRIKALLVKALLYGYIVRLFEGYGRRYIVARVGKRTTKIDTVIHLKGIPGSEALPPPLLKCAGLRSFDSL